MTAINRIATAVPDLDFEADYRRWAMRRLDGTREARLYERMADRSGIEHRWSVLTAEDAKLEEGVGLYGGAQAPGTAERMAIYAEEAPKLALKAIEGLSELGDITHLVVASCTGFVAPGIDQIIARRLGLADDIERVLIGFMGCYAAVTALRTARHITRSQEGARVLVVTVELSTLHHQEQMDIEPLLMGAQFGDGSAAAIVSGDLITWHIGDTGFNMRLSGEVPGRIVAALANPEVRDRVLGGAAVEAFDAWAVHAGGRSILDAVEKGFSLAPGALDASREVLRNCGNMSSSTLMFVLARLIREKPQKGVALAFGPGLAMEGFRFGWSDA